MADHRLLLLSGTCRFLPFLVNTKPSQVRSTSTTFHRNTSGYRGFAIIELSIWRTNPGGLEGGSPTSHSTARIDHPLDVEIASVTSGRTRQPSGSFVLIVWRSKFCLQSMTGDHVELREQPVVQVVAVHTVRVAGPDLAAGRRDTIPHGDDDHRPAQHRVTRFVHFLSFIVFADQHLSSRLGL